MDHFRCRGFSLKIFLVFALVPPAPPRASTAILVARVFVEIGGGFLGGHGAKDEESRVLTFIDQPGHEKVRYSVATRGEERM